MSNAKHTPGPWEAKRHNDDPDNYWNTIVNEQGVNICTFHHAAQASKPFAEADANAYLIAAAPELQEAISEAIAFITWMAFESSETRHCSAEFRSSVNSKTNELLAAYAKSRGEA